MQLAHARKPILAMKVLRARVSAIKILLAVALGLLLIVIFQNNARLSDTSDDLVRPIFVPREVQAPYRGLDHEEEKREDPDETMICLNRYIYPFLC